MLDFISSIDQGKSGMRSRRIVVVLAGFFSAAQIFS